MALRRTLVAVVHDDESVREWLPDLLGEFGFEARAFASAEEFLVSDCLPDTGCVVLDRPGLVRDEIAARFERKGPLRSGLIAWETRALYPGISAGVTARSKWAGPMS